MRVLILGAGGHAQVVADILIQRQRQDRSLTILGYLDDNPQLAGSAFLGFRVLGPIAHAEMIEHDTLVIGIGDNQIRKRLFDDLTKRGEQFATVCHPSAVIGSEVTLASGTVVCAGVVVNPGSEIGANVILNTGSTVEHHCRISDHVHIGPGVHLGGDVHVGTETLIGIGATVLPQIHIGSWTVVGAGAVVTRHLPDSIVAVGMPASIISTRNKGQL